MQLPYDRLVTAVPRCELPRTGAGPHAAYDCVVRCGAVWSGGRAVAWAAHLQSSRTHTSLPTRPPARTLTLARLPAHPRAPVPPTRHVRARQVHEVFQGLCSDTPLRVGMAAGQGGVSWAQERAAVVGTDGSSTVDVLVATPGRLIEHLQAAGGYRLEHLAFLVVDEADRLLSQVRAARGGGGGGGERRCWGKGERGSAGGSGAGVVVPRSDFESRARSSSLVLVRRTPLRRATRGGFQRCSRRRTAVGATWAAAAAATAAAVMCASRFDRYMTVT